MFTKEQKIVLINLVMILDNFVHSVAHSSFYHCIIQFEAIQKDQCRGFPQLPVGIISDFQIPYRSEWLQVYTQHSTHAESSWFQCFSVWLRLCHAESLAKVLVDYNQIFDFFKQISNVACWPPAPRLTEVSNRARFRNPELGMLFCLFIKQTVLNIVSVQHCEAGVWLIAWNWQNHFEICRFYCTTFLDSCLYPSNM